MPYHTQLNTRIHPHGRDTASRFDALRSESNYSAFSYSLKCAKEWITRSLADLTLADVLDIRVRACAAAGMAASAVAGGR